MSKKEKAILLKMKMAVAFMNEVSTLIHNKFYNTAINRLYYSCYHATRALLLTKDFAPKTHKGLVTMLHQEFVLKDLFEPKKASFFSTLMDERNESDYGDFLILDENDIAEFIQPATEYLEYVSKIIDEFLAAQRTNSTSE